MKQKCSNAFSLVALVNVILVTTVLYIESTILYDRVYFNISYMIEKKQNHLRMPAESYIFSLYEGM